MRIPGYPSKQFQEPWLGLAASLLSIAGLFAGNDPFIIGATVHFEAGRGLSEAENLKVLKETGMISPRDDSGWRTWEKEKGVYSSRNPVHIEKALEMGLEPLQILGYGNPFYDGGNYPNSPEAVEAHAKYCEFVVSKYKGRCHLYQLWNEWDGGCGMREFKRRGFANSDLYVRLAEMAYPRMKTLDPSITVIANSVCTGEKFLEEMLKEGVLKACDGIAFHAYLYGESREGKRSPEAYFERIAGVDRLVKRYNDGQDFPIYLTETGWPNHIKPSGSADAETGDYIARCLFLIRTIRSVKGLWWYDFQCSGLDPEYNESNFGMVRPDLTPKEAYYVLRSISDIIRKGSFTERLTTAEDGLVALKFKMPDGQDALAAWSVLKDCNLQVTLKNSSSVKGTLKTFRAGFPAIERAWGAREWVGFRNQDAKRNAPFLPDRFQFTTLSRPFVVLGDLTGVEIESVKRISFPNRALKSTVNRVPADIIQVPPCSTSGNRTKFGSAVNYRSLAGAPYAEKDLDASFTLSWEKDFLSLVIEVFDDRFVQKEFGGNAWNDDSVQAAFQNLAKSADQNVWSEYTPALTENGPEAYREFSQIQLPKGKSENVQLTVKRDATKSIYTAKFPAKELGFAELAPKTIFGFSILVNDNDGSGRKGYLHWGDGIGMEKDPYDYNWCVLQE